MDVLYQSLREARAYAHLAEAHLQECEVALQVAKRKRDEAATEQQQAMKELARMKSEFDKEFGDA